MNSDRFHAHLDVCTRCRNHPFNLCATGARLLREAAAGVMDEDVKIIVADESTASVYGEPCV